MLSPVCVSGGQSSRRLVVDAKLVLDVRVANHVCVSFNFGQLLGDGLESSLILSNLHVVLSSVHVTNVRVANLVMGSFSVCHHQFELLC